jgi:hypothetical protein
MRGKLVLLAWRPETLYRTSYSLWRASLVPSSQRDLLRRQNVAEDKISGRHETLVFIAGLR